MYIETPYITTTEKIIAITGEELHINCHVESLVPFTVTWKAQNYTHYTWNFKYCLLFKCKNYRYFHVFLS